MANRGPTRVWVNGEELDADLTSVILVNSLHYGPHALIDGVSVDAPCIIHLQDQSMDEPQLVYVAFTDPTIDFIPFHDPCVNFQWEWGE